MLRRFKKSKKPFKTYLRTPIVRRRPNYCTRLTRMDGALSFTRARKLPSAPLLIVNLSGLLLPKRSLAVSARRQASAASALTSPSQAKSPESGSEDRAVATCGARIKISAMRVEFIFYHGTMKCP